jgi:photosynthesis system II assembly factor YCF48-like protein
VNASDDRDRALERLLRQPVKARPPGATESCLDAEQLAAWAEGSLSGPELEVAQAHAADCARCQAMLATLTVIARDAATAAAHSSATPARANRRWLAWFVPLTATAAALAIWVAVPRGPGVSPSPPGPDNQRQAAKEAAPGPAAAPEVQPPAATALQSAPQTRDQVESDKAKLSDLRKDSDQEKDRLKEESQRDEPGLAAKAAPAPAPAAPPPAAAAAPPAREAFEQRSANSLSADQKVDAIASSIAAGIRWRLAGARLERSADGGTTWAQVAVPIASELTAISSASGAVCWAVGRNGVVLRTTDGRNFSPVAFPETLDLLAIQATDALSAVVTARDGRIFRTADGGRTWAP